MRRGSAQAIRTNLRRGTTEGEPFDLTPVIDVVFLLIIFFMLVCHFMAEEQFTVAVPDAIQAGQSAGEEAVPLTLTIFMDEQQETVCAVGSERLAGVKGKDLRRLITSTVNEGLSGSGDKTVRLRCDKRVTFGQVKYVLAGLAESSAEQLDWAVLK
jgi:biopolymer transport protein ExbD